MTAEIFMMWMLNSASSSSDNNLVVRNNFYKGLRKDDFAVVIQYFQAGWKMSQFGELVKYS